MKFITIQIILRKFSPELYFVQFSQSNLYEVSCFTVQLDSDNSSFRLQSILKSQVNSHQFKPLSFPHDSHYIGNAPSPERTRIRITDFRFVCHDL